VDGTAEDPAVAALDATYRTLLESVGLIDDESGWAPTRCLGWSRRDLVLHLLADAQRALVALHTPGDGPVDVDAVTYWAGWQPGTPGADAGRRGTRIMASAWTSVVSIVELYDETARAVLDATHTVPVDSIVQTQGKRLTVSALCSTLAVEAAIHHVDLRLGDPAQLGLAEARRVLDGLLGRPGPVVDDVRYVLVGTGREPLTEGERGRLGADADRLPLFG
jgi:uncharacterized protein (TIGR03083 family)